jgi:hypothetical protein
MSAQAIAIFSQGLTAEEVEGLADKLNADEALTEAIVAHSAVIGPSLQPSEVAQWRLALRPMLRGLSLTQLWEQGYSFDLMHPLGHFLNVGRRSGSWSIEKWRLLVNYPDLPPQVLRIGRLLMRYFGSPKLIYAPDTGLAASMVVRDEQLEVIEQCLREQKGLPSTSFAAIVAAVREGRQEQVDDGYVIDLLPGR